MGIDSHRGQKICSFPRVVPCFPLLGLTPSGLFMGLSSTIILHFRVNSLFHYLCFQFCKIIWFYQLSWLCELPNVSSASPSLDSLRRRLALETSAPESLYGGQFTLSTQLIKPNYLGKISHTWKIVSHLEIGSHLKEWVTLGNMGRFWKNGSHLKKWLTLEKNG